jgi:hypothetical protein
MNGLRWTAAVGTALTGLSLAACVMMGDGRDLSALQTALAKRYGETTDIDLANREQLTVKFENSKFADLEEPGRSDFARGVAVFVFTQYARRDSISSIKIGFRSVIGVPGLTLNHTETPYSWTAAELRAASDSAGRNSVKMDTAEKRGA